MNDKNVFILNFSEMQYELFLIADLGNDLWQPCKNIGKDDGFPNHPNLNYYWVSKSWDFNPKEKIHPGWSYQISYTQIQHLWEWDSQTASKAITLHKQEKRKTNKQKTLIQIN